MKKESLDRGYWTSHHRKIDKIKSVAFWSGFVLVLIILTCGMPDWYIFIYAPACVLSTGVVYHYFGTSITTASICLVLVYVLFFILAHMPFNSY